MVEKKDDILLGKFAEVLESCSDPLQQKTDAIITLKITYSELSDYLAQAGWIERVETIQVEATYIASIAGVAVFLGAIQMGFISYAANIVHNSNTGSTSNHIQEAVNILSFCALLFDILGALFAIITSGTLLLRASEAKRFTITKQKLCDEIIKALQSFTDIPEKRADSQDFFITLHDKGQRYHVMAQGLAYLIDNQLRGYFDVILVIIAGVVFFFASFILFIINTQHLRVCVPTVVIVGVTTMMLLYMQTRRRPNIRRLFSTYRTAFLNQCRTLLRNHKPQNTVLRDSETPLFSTS